VDTHREVFGWVVPESKAQRVTQTELETQFKNGITDFDALDKTIKQRLTKQAALAQDRSGAGRVREGIRMAALEFYWNSRQQVNDGTTPTVRIVI
jgi:hypothetical protein